MGMDPTEKLSFKITRTSLYAVLIVGSVLASIQVFLDYREQIRLIDANIQEIIHVSATPATRAVYHLDIELAQEVVNGLTEYDFLHHISIRDEAGNVMAIYDQPVEPSSTRWLTELLQGTSNAYSQALSPSEDTIAGELLIKLNNDRALAPIYQRGLTIFLTGIAKGLLLGLILNVIYHRLITRPLHGIAGLFSQVSNQPGHGTRLPKLEKHQHDELGKIIESANHLLQDLQHREEDICESEKQLRIIINASPNLVFALNDSGQFVFLNVATANFYQTTIDALVNRRFDDVHSSISEKETESFNRLLKQCRTSLGKSIESEMFLHGSDGEGCVLNVSLIPYTLYNQRCVLAIANDVTARIEAENRIERLAYFDTLTQLPNRHQIQNRLEDDIRYSQKQQAFGALMFIDLDDFKRINSTLGHSTGDALLLKVSNRMQTQIRKSEMLARLSGDQFVLSVPGIHQEEDKAVDIVSQLADRLLRNIAKPLHLGEHELEISASIGIAMYPKPNQDFEKLFSAADTAMHQAKTQGPGKFIVFESHMSEAASRRVRLESDLRRAVAEDHFIFHLQPILSSTDSSLVCAEALLRWQDPERGCIMPGAFIEYLENSPMMGKVGEKILDQVCAFIYHCRNKGSLDYDFRIAVNVSAQEFFQKNYYANVKRTLEKYHLSGECLELEITESAALLHLEEAIEKMHALKALGIRFALDDFGTGYSSLSYLKQLPFDKIKIDKSFIKDLTIDQQDAMLVASIIAIAKTLNMDVVAEGVETEDQAAWLSLHGPVLFQGFLFDRPMQIDRFEQHYLHPNPTYALPI